MGRWRTASLVVNHIAVASRSYITPTHHPPRPPNLIFASIPFAPSLPLPLLLTFRSFSAISSRALVENTEFYSAAQDFDQNYGLDPKQDEETIKIPVKAYFLCTSINLKSIQADYVSNVIPPTSRSTNYVALRFYDFPASTTASWVGTKVSFFRYMVIFQYGSAVLFNIEDHEVETYLEIIKRHASGLLPEMRKDDYAIKEKPLLDLDMQGGPDYIVLKNLDMDSIRIMGSVLGQSIALEYFVSQVDGMLEEFAEINRGMEKTGTFTMRKKKLLQLVGKANSNLADVILKVGIFERSEIAWRDAKYAQIYEYLREEYEVTQRFGNLDFKLKFVEHNIHFLQEVLQNRKSDFLEWCIIGLLTIENAISLYEIVRDSSAVSL